MKNLESFIFDNFKILPNGEKILFCSKTDKTAMENNFKNMFRQFIFSLFLLISYTVFGQQFDFVDFQKAKGTLEFFPEEKRVSGQMEYTFKILQDTDSVFLDARNMEVRLLNTFPKKSFKLEYDTKEIKFIGDFKAGEIYSAQIEYQTQNPKQSLYFVGWEQGGSNQIWTQGQGKETSYWLPSLDDTKDKIIFDITYVAPKEHRVIANGKLVDEVTAETHKKWRYQMNHPMSSYLLAVAVGNYEKEVLFSKNGTPIELYYEPEFAPNLEATFSYSKEIFGFLEEEIGYPYPWENYKMIPVRDFLYAGMENTTATIFSESFMTDSIGFIDRNFVNVSAHELAHQWFGDMVTAWSPASHWLQEGFATYYALLAEKEIFGEDYFYFQLYQSAETLKAESDKGKGEALTNPKAGALTFYQKGAWALHILREKLGEESFKKGVRAYLEKYKYQNVTIEDFIEEMEKASGADLFFYMDNWLNQTAFQADDALASLKKSPFIKRYMELAALRNLPLSEKFDALNRALSFPINSYLGQEAVYQLAVEKPSNQRIQLYQKAFDSGDVLVRQAIALSLTDIPLELQKQYEGFLADASWLTREKALFNLWNNFPGNQIIYLDALQDQQGFYDKNLRMLWLTLALVTPDYKNQKKSGFYEELSAYTSLDYDYSIRQNAFGYLYQLDLFSDQNYRDLLQACVHPVWRFRNFARELLDKLAEDENHRSKLFSIKSFLPENQSEILEKSLNKAAELKKG